MLDATFFSTALRERVRAECERQPDQVPVVLLHLADGTAVDVCHILHLADGWLAVAYFRDSTACDEMDTAYIRYDLVTRVTLSLHQRKSRRLGFDVAKSQEAYHV